MTAGQWTTTGQAIEESKEAKQAPNGQNYQPGRNVFCGNFSLISNSCPKIHNAVLSMVVD